MDCSQHFRESHDDLGNQKIYILINPRKIWTILSRKVTIKKEVIMFNWLQIVEDPGGQTESHFDSQRLFMHICCVNWFYFRAIGLKQ